MWACEQGWREEEEEGQGGRKREREKEEVMEGSERRKVAEELF